MKAVILREIASLKQNPSPLSFEEMEEPKLKEGEVLLRVTRCGVCHTELDEIEGRTPPPHLPVILGHQVVGTVQATGSSTQTMKKGDRVGVAWIYAADGACPYCRSGQENLCPNFRATGR